MIVCLKHVLTNDPSQVCSIRQIPAWHHSPGWSPGRALDCQCAQHRSRQRRCVVPLELRRRSEPPAERCADSPSADAPDPAEPPAASAPSPAPDERSSPDSGQPVDHTHRQRDRPETMDGQNRRMDRWTGSATCCMSPSRLSVELVRMCRFAKASLYGTDSGLTWKHKKTPTVMGLNCSFIVKCFPWLSKVLCCDRQITQQATRGCYSKRKQNNCFSTPS